MDNKLQKVDHAALRVNQTFIISLSLLGFIFSAWWLPARQFAFWATTS